MSHFEWPWQYNFPPFFTLQNHQETREKQIDQWISLGSDLYLVVNGPPCAILIVFLVFFLN